jgi:hypothetical protein
MVFKKLVASTLELRKADSSLTTPELRPKEQTSLFGGPEKRSGPVLSE